MREPARRCEQERSGHPVTSLIANARMYAVTPAVKAAWQDLFAWVAETSGVPLAWLDHAAPAPLEALWARSDLGTAFMCGFPFASAAPQPVLLAAPVPSPERYGGAPRYCTDLVVRTESRYARLADTFGGRLGWTVHHSQSGCNAVRHHLLEHDPKKWVPGFGHDRAQDGARGPDPLYADWVGPLITPRGVIAALLEDRIDVGPLDSYVHDLIRRHDPETAAKLRVVASTAMTPIPPLVASSGADRDATARLRSALLSCHSAPAMADTLHALLLSRFDAVDAADYRMLLAWEQQSDAGGIPKPE